MILLKAGGNFTEPFKDRATKDLQSVLAVHGEMYEALREWARIHFNLTTTIVINGRNVNAGLLAARMFPEIATRYAVYSENLWDPQIFKLITQKLPRHHRACNYMFGLFILCADRKLCTTASRDQIVDIFCTLPILPYDLSLARFPHLIDSDDGDF